MFIQTEIEQLRKDITDLKLQLKQKEARYNDLCMKQEMNCYNEKFSADEVTRYSRQMLIPSIGVNGQNSLKQSKVLIIGIGGLGCPAALYLVAAGVGELTLVDNDEVELTNLHRQILHSQNDIGIPKVESAFDKLAKINSEVKINPIHMHIDSQSLMKLLNNNNFNVVIDCTDNVASRYLINDACVIKKIPLVSGSALQFEGQLTVYSYMDAPCYRCLFPIPPPPHTVTSCGDGGVIGVVPGVIGVLQALETIKIIINIPGVLSGRLLIFDGADGVFRNVKLRNKNFNCEVCGTNPIITKLIDYEQFCGAKAHDKIVNINILNDMENIDVIQFKKLSDECPILIDVRSEMEFNMCHLPNSINIPYTDIAKNKNLDILKNLMPSNANQLNVYVLCRRGNDSQRAICKLKELFCDEPFIFFNIKGGLHSYAQLIDSTFPIY